MTSRNTNPAGKAGKPFSLAPHSFEDALKKILSAPPEPKPEKGKSVKKNKHAKKINK